MIFPKKVRARRIRDVRYIHAENVEILKLLKHFLKRFEIFASCTSGQMNSVSMRADSIAEAVELAEHDDQMQALQAKNEVLMQEVVKCGLQLEVERENLKETMAARLVAGKKAVLVTKQLEDVKAESAQVVKRVALLEVEVEKQTRFAKETSKTRSAMEKTSMKQAEQLELAQAEIAFLQAKLHESSEECTSLKDLVCRLRLEHVKEPPSTSPERHVPGALMPPRGRCPIQFQGKGSSSTRTAAQCMSGQGSDGGKGSGGSKGSDGSKCSNSGLGSKGGGEGGKGGDTNSGLGNKGGSKGGKGGGACSGLGSKGSKGGGKVGKGDGSRFDGGRGHQQGGGKHFGFEAAVDGGGIRNVEKKPFLFVADAATIDRCFEADTFACTRGRAGGYPDLKAGDKLYLVYLVKGKRGKDDSYSGPFEALSSLEEVGPEGQVFRGLNDFKLPFQVRVGLPSKWSDAKWYSATSLESDRFGRYKTHGFQI